MKYKLARWMWFSNWLWVPIPGRTLQYTHDARIRWAWLHWIYCKCEHVDSPYFVRPNAFRR